MALTVVVEDGTGKTDANSYVSAAEATAYQESNPFGAAWAALSSTQKDQAVVTATRMVDQQFQWNGYKANSAQALQWPRQLCPDPDALDQAVPGATSLSNGMLASDAVPKAIKDAVCALALVAIQVNREVDPSGEGISSFTLEGVMSVAFDKATRQNVLPAWISANLSKYGGPMRSGGGVAKLSRA